MNKKGFTLLEVLVVISIISILASVILSAVNTARDSAEAASAAKMSRSFVGKNGVCLQNYFRFDENDEFVDSRQGIGSVIYGDPEFVGSGSARIAKFDGEFDENTDPVNSYIVLDPIDNIYRIGMVMRVNSPNQDPSAHPPRYTIDTRPGFSSWQFSGSTSGNFPTVIVNEKDSARLWNEVPKDEWIYIEYTIDPNDAPITSGPTLMARYAPSIARFGQQTAAVDLYSVSIYNC